MESMSLEKIILINMGIGLWMRNEMKAFIITRPNVVLEKALQNLKMEIHELPIALHLKNRLTNLVERIGYELYLFLNKFIANDIFDLSGIEWTTDGLINEIKTLRVCLKKASKFFLAHFRAACMIFDELSIRNIWGNFTENDRELCRTSTRNLLFPAYWIYEIENRLEDFSADYGYFMLGFDGGYTLYINMLRHSIATNNKNAIFYFYGKLTENELEIFRSGREKNIEHDLVIHTLTSRGEGHKFILSYFEKPNVCYKIKQLILNTMTCEQLKHFLEFVLRQVNVFGALHFNIFCYLLHYVGRRCVQTVEENLDFYALTLLSKGKFEKFEFLSNLDSKKILRQRVYSRMRQKSGLAIFLTIHFNKHTQLLHNFFEWLAVCDNDKEFFNQCITALIAGTLFEIQMENP